MRGSTKCVAVFMAALSLVLASFSRGLLYYYDTIRHMGSGVRYHVDQDTDGDGVVMHADKQVWLNFDVVESRLKAMPKDLSNAASGVSHLPALAEHDVNPSGYAGISSWPLNGLGTAAAEHKVMREFLNARVSRKAPASLWSADALRSSAKAFLKEKDTLEVSSAACTWVDMELWRILLGVEMPPAEASALCDEYMMNFLLHYYILPKWTEVPQCCCHGCCRRRCVCRRSFCGSCSCRRCSCRTCSCCTWRSC
jgi:hypothetical protein